MTKLYAVVKPPHSFSVHNILDMSFLVMLPIHKLMYEYISRFSLGHQAEFFDSLDEAKAGFEIAIATNKELVYEEVVQQGILELECEQGRIVRCSIIYTVKDIQKKEDSFFKMKSIPLWQQRIVTCDELSTQALSELNKQYKHVINHQPMENMAL